MPYEKKNTVKKVEKPKGPIRGGLMKRTLKELESLDIRMIDIYTFDTIGINLSWDKLIRLVNYNADAKVLRWSNTFEEALEVIKIFLV